MIRMRPDAPVAFTILDSMPLRQLLLYAADLPGTWPLLPLDPTPHREREMVAMVMDGIGEGLRAITTGTYWDRSGDMIAQVYLDGVKEAFRNA